jgi:hypothetical protein
MADEHKIATDEVVTDDVSANSEANNPDYSPNPLADALWGEVPVEKTAVAEQPKDDTKPAAQEEEKPKDEETETFDEVEYLKKNFEVESIDAIKAEREELKKLREQKPQELKFENDKSKQVYDLLQAGKVDEVLEIYNQEKKIDKTLSLEVNKDTAEEIIKTGMSLKYKDLSPSEINYKYNKEFGLPKEPKQATDELDEDFAVRKSEWDEKVKDIEMSKVIEAKLLRPELESSKSKIALPELGQMANAAPKPTQEDLDNFKRQQEAFVKSANTVLNDFTGFATQVKDKDVDYSVSYTPSKEEKEIVGKVLQRFAEDGFNPNAIFADLWVKEDGTIDVNRLTRDVMRLYTGDKSDAKIANDAAGQRMEQYLKNRKNINLKDVNEASPAQNIDNKSYSERLAEKFWN